MKRRLITVILFAVLAATISSTVLYRIISANSQPTVQAGTAKVFVAARDLTAGTVVANADVREVEWPVAGGSPWIRRRTDVVGRELMSTIGKDEPFADVRLAPKGAAAGPASRIPRGMRAVAVHVDELTGLSRFILPGMHVDVISTGAQGPQGMQARTILQDVEVFSNGQSLDSKDKPAGVPVFNLLVTPQQAELLSQAVAQSRVELVLRNPLDKGSIAEQTPVVHPAHDMQAPKVAKSAPKAPAQEKQTAAATPAPPTVEVIHGSKRSTNIVATSPDSETK